MFRQTARVLQTAAASSSTKSVARSQRTKLTTGLTGVDVHSDPLVHLNKTYESTLALLSRMPAGAVYRQSVESIIRDRKAVIDRISSSGSSNSSSGKKGEGQGQGQGVTESEIEQVENGLGQGQIEEVIMAAEDELRLAGKMLEWKPWEELVEEAPRGQWTPFAVTPSTTTADDLK